MKINKTNAIVLRRTNYSEADRILQLLTPNGKASVMARGVRKEKSRLSGGIELFSICEVSISDGRGELGVLTSSRLIKFFNHILEDYDRMQFGYQVVKLISGVSESVDSPELYDLLAETLAGLDSLKTNFDLIQTWFYIHYAELTGYELSLWNDVDGNRIVEGRNYQYDVIEKGLRQEDTGKLTSDNIKLLRLISTRTLKTLAQIGGIETVISSCMMIAKEHASIHVSM